MDPSNNGERAPPNRRVLMYPVRVLNRSKLSAAYARISISGVETPATAVMADSIERQLYEQASNELDYLTSVSSFIQGMDDSPEDLQPLARLLDIARSNNPPQPQPPAGPLTVASSSGFPQQPPQQQPQQEEPGFEATHISEHDLKRFEDLWDWHARRRRENGSQ